MKSDKSESEWWVKEYAEDVHTYWKRRELKLLPFHEQSPQLLYRNFLVEYMEKICKCLHFCTRVKHLAVYYLDSFMDHHNIDLQHLQFVAVCCLIVAVKVDESEALILKMSEFSYLLHNQYSIEQLIEMELAIMTFLKWELLVPTVAAFSEYYVLHSVADDDLYTRVQLQSAKAARIYLQRYIDFFLEVSLQDCAYRKFLPSIVAASAVALSRLCLGIKPLWPDYLQERTLCSFEEIKDCFTKMINSVRAAPVDQIVNTSNAEIDDDDSEETESDDDSDSLSIIRDKIDEEQLRIVSSNKVVPNIPSISDS